MHFEAGTDDMWHRKILACCGAARISMVRFNLINQMHIGGILLSAFGTPTEAKIASTGSRSIRAMTKK